MQMHPAIAALRSDPASQRRAQLVCDNAHRQWLSRTEVRAISEEFEHYAAGECLQKLPALSALMVEADVASGFVNLAVSSLLGALRKEPLGEIPLGHASSENHTCLRVFSRGGAALSLLTHSPAPHEKAPTSVQFTDCELEALVLSGRARCFVHKMGEARQCLTTREIALRAGSRISCRPRNEARQIVEIERTLLVLQLTRTPEQPQPSREVRLSDGAIVRQASGDRRASEQVMALAVLGTLADMSSIPHMAEFALDQSCDRDARWEAVRQVLALDTSAGFELLSRLANRPTDSLTEPASQLRRQISAAYPALRELSQENA